MSIETILGFVALIVVIIGIIGFLISRLQVVPPSEALIVSGARSNKGGTKVIPPGGRVFVIPLIQESTVINLSQISLALDVNGVDENNVPINVAATANIKVGSSPEMIRAAAERFSSKENFSATIRDNVEPVLLGSLRAIISEMSVRSLLTKRSILAEKVLEAAKPELRTMGFALDSLTVNEISDANGYIEALSVPEAAEVSKAARIARANANKIANEAEVAAQIDIAEKKQSYDIRQAELKAIIDAENAKAQAAKPLADAEQLAKISEADEKAAQKTAALKARQLEIEVEKPADAELYFARQKAAADKVARIAEAEAEAEAIRIKGEAEANSISAIGRAEAESMQKKAEAFKQYNEAAVTELIIKKLPEIVSAYAEPISRISEMTVVSTDGANHITTGIASGIAQVGSLVESLTGYNIRESLSGKDSSVVIDDTTTEDDDSGNNTHTTVLVGEDTTSDDLVFDLEN